nr:28S ribosomal protein S9, mitochondrial [Tanacetum cinerariifolium]
FSLLASVTSTCISKFIMALKVKSCNYASFPNKQVDSQGRAYGTGKRKCSIARVWIEPGEGKFLINDNQFDVYFPMLDQRAALLRPLTETKTLGLLDVNCTVKGGGVSGQIGAIRLGMSRALQNWAQDQFCRPLKEVFM